MNPEFKVTARFEDRSFWLDENQKYARRHFRLEKCARIVNKLASGRECDLLDIGCGPATLAELLAKNINYYGVDIALHSKAPNLLELDFANNEIRFGENKFDIVVAAGVFEYLGDLQKKKFCEIRSLLKEEGRFIATYTNFGHSHYLTGNPPPYNNIQSIQAFTKELRQYFHVDSCFPHAINWMSTEPRRQWLRRLQMNMNFNIPIVSSRLALGYFFICS